MEGNVENQSEVYCRYGPPQQTRHRLIVENLSSRCSWQVRKCAVLRERRSEGRGSAAIVRAASPTTLIFSTNLP